MYIQNQIKRTISTPASREIIRKLLQDKEIKNRTKLAKRVCEEFNFYDTRGQAQISGCTKGSAGTGKSRTYHLACNQ